MNNHIQPKGKQVRVMPDKVEDVTAGGIIKTTKSKSNTGIVLDLSPDYSFPFEVGARVQYSPNQQLELEDGSILINGSEDGSIFFVFN